MRVHRSCVTRLRSIPLGRYCRISPFVFSLVPLSQAWWGVAKYTLVFRMLSSSLSLWNSQPLSAVMLFFVPQQAHRSSQRLLLRRPVDFSDPHDSALPFHHCQHAGLAPAVHRVDLPISDPFPALHHRRPLLDHRFSGQASPAVMVPKPLPSAFLRSPQMLPQCPSPPLVRPDPFVDSLVAHHLRPLPFSSPHDLLRTQFPPNQYLDGRKLLLPKPQI